MLTCIKNLFHQKNCHCSECKYDEPPYSDCDPFHLVKWRTLKLVSGPSSCEASRNDTKQCSSDQFPPGEEIQLSFMSYLKKNPFYDHYSVFFRFFKLETFFYSLLPYKFHL